MISEKLQKVKNELREKWLNNSKKVNFSIRSDETNKQGYYWPNIDKFSFDHQIKTFKPVISEINDIVKNKGTVLQAGGNCGVYTFEPDTTNMNCLILNTLQSNNIIKFQACLGDKHGMTAIQNPLEIMDTGSIHVKTEKELDERMLVVHSKANVPILKIDDIQFDNLDLIHLDIEGYELYALKGGIETIKKYKPVIVLEVCDNGHSERFSYTKDDLEEFLKSLGYTFIKNLESNNDNVYMYTEN